jgi:GDP-L-fucose synthase
MARTPFELKGKRVFVAGHRGMVGGALVRRLAGEGVELLTVPRGGVDFRDQVAVSDRFAHNDGVIYRAARRGFCRRDKSKFCCRKIAGGR